MAEISSCSQVTSNNGTFFSPGVVGTANNGTVVLTTNTVVNGTDIRHTPGSSSILLSVNKTYYVYYKCVTAALNPGTALSCQLLLNGIPINGSKTTVTGGGAAQQQPEIAAGIILNTTSSPDPNILQLQNVSGGGRSIAIVTLTVIRLK